MRISQLICFHPNNNQVNWATFDSKGQLNQGATQVDLDTLELQNNPTFILVPGTEVLLTQADVPSRQWQRIIQAVPYALEEQLAEDVENLHFALGKTKDGYVAVAVIARTLMDSYLQQLPTLGLTSVVLIPDILAVPKPNDGWGMLLLDEIALVRTDSYAGFAIETECLHNALSVTLLEHESNPPSQITIFSGSESLASTIDLTTLGIPIIEKNHSEGILAWMAQELVATKPLNLLQGDYRSQDKMVSLLRPWRLTALLLLFWGGLIMAEQWLEYRQLRQQRQALNTQIEKVYRETFPSAHKIVNPRVQMKQKLVALRTQQGDTSASENFLPLLTKISPQLVRTSGFELKQLDYRQGQFDLQLTVTSLQALEHLKRRLTNLGLNVEIQSANSHLNKVASRLRIKPLK